MRDAPEPAKDEPQLPLAAPSFPTVHVTGALEEFPQEASWGTKLWSLIVQLTESVPNVPVMLPLGAVKELISTASAGAGATSFCEGLAEGLGVGEADADGVGFFEGLSLVGSSACCEVPV